MSYGADFLQVERHLQKHQIDSSISRSWRVCFLRPKILSTNQIAWLCHIRHLQNDLAFWLHFLYDSLESWLKSIEWVLVTNGCCDFLQVYLKVKLVLSLSQRILSLKTLTNLVRLPSHMRCFPRFGAICTI